MKYEFSKFNLTKEVPIPKPKDKAVCANCQKRRGIRKTISHWIYKGAGFFCSKKCQAEYANNTVIKELLILKEQTNG